MEVWLFYSLIAALLLGFFSFTTKIASERKLDETYILFFLYLFSSIYSVIYLFLFGEFILNSITIIIAVIMGIGYPYVLKTRLISLRYISASTYFINYRIFSSTILLGLGVLIFSEVLNYFQLLGILIGFLVFYLLLEKKTSSETNVEFKKGILFLFIGIVLVSLLHVAAKYNAVNNPEFFTYNLLHFTIGTIFFIFTKFDKIKQINSKTKNIKFIIWFSALQGLLFSGNGMFFYYAYQVGNLAIVYKTISYSLFIPVVLSIIVYKEKVDFKKVIAFVLTVVSIYLFTI
ncbi:MAG: EamA family transporter [Nanoarchaeales archaeon]|nr:EamA family transporter [Nanoarchaeales archaeon]